MGGIDQLVLAVYFVLLVGAGVLFRKRSATVEGFTVAGRALPGWVCGLSIFGTYLSSNTFIGVPGKAYASNWNAYVFTLSIPIAAWIAVRFFVPFYRQHSGLSAYGHLEQRFGAWARVYVVVCYLLTQLSRMGSIMFGVAIGLQALTGWSLPGIIVVSGVAVTLYTLMGGIEAVIWTDAIQSVILSVGALVVLGLAMGGMPEGPGQAISIAAGADKFSLGSLGASLAQPTVWVVLMYGIFINLTNFGIDQNFIQRYHAAKSPREAARAVWLGALLYVPISLVFFFIGSILFAYYQASPELLQKVREAKALEEFQTDSPQADAASADAKEEIAAKAAEFQPGDYGDKVLPHFIATQMPPGLAGLLIAALFAAAMSSIDTSLNSSSTVLLEDFYKRWIRHGAGERESLRFLRVTTVVWGALGTGIALAMIGVESILDAWWKISGVFAGGMLGLFMLGFISRRANNAGAAVGAAIGVLVILWMTFSPELSDDLAWLRSPFHSHMITVIGTLTIFLAGHAVSTLLPYTKTQETA